MNKKAINYINKNIHCTLENKTVIITGGNSGIGFQSALYFCYLKANVIITARNLQRGEVALNKIKSEIPNANISMMELDVSHESSIKQFVKEIRDKKIDIDIFYHNAGIYRLPFEIIEDKEIIIGTNYYGQLILTSLLLPYLHSLKHEVKMFFTSSLAASYTNYKKLCLIPNENLGRATRYANSKLLDAFLFNYLYINDNKNIKYYLVHPGFTSTGLFKKAYKNKIILKFADLGMPVISNPLWKSSLSCLIPLKDETMPGTFIGPNHFFKAKGYPKQCKFLNKKYKNVNEIINESEKIVGYKLID